MMKFNVHDVRRLIAAALPVLSVCVFVLLSFQAYELMVRPFVDLKLEFTGARNTFKAAQLRVHWSICWLILLWLTIVGSVAVAALLGSRLRSQFTRGGRRAAAGILMVGVLLGFGLEWKRLFFGGPFTDWLLKQFIQAEPVISQQLAVTNVTTFAAAWVVVIGTSLTCWLALRRSKDPASVSLAMRDMETLLVAASVLITIGAAEVSAFFRMPLCLANPSGNEADSLAQLADSLGFAAGALGTCVLVSCFGPAFVILSRAARAIAGERSSTPAESDKFMAEWKLATSLRSYLVSGIAYLLPFLVSGSLSQMVAKSK